MSETTDQARRGGNGVPPAVPATGHPRLELHRAVIALGIIMSALGAVSEIILR